MLHNRSFDPGHREHYKCMLYCRLHSTKALARAVFAHCSEPLPMFPVRICIVPITLAARGGSTLHSRCGGDAVRAEADVLCNKLSATRRNTTPAALLYLNL